VSVAGEPEKGKSERIRNSWRLLWEWMEGLVAFEVPQQQNKEDDNGQHKNAEMAARAFIRYMIGYTL
jgi:hypothetical protein